MGKLKCFSCISCGWTQETKKQPHICPRCLAADVQRVSVEQFLKMMDRGETRMCNACGIIHTR